VPNVRQPQLFQRACGQIAATRRAD